MRLPLRKCDMSLTSCWSWDKMIIMMVFPVRTLQDVTHWQLLVIGQAVMRLPVRKMCNATHFLLVIHKTRGDDIAFWNNVHWSLTSCGHRTRCSGTQISFQRNVQCHLLSVGRCHELGFQKNVQCHLHSVGHRMRLPFTGSTMCNFTHHLLEDVMRVPSRERCNGPGTHKLL